jgi:hypothetical protein
MESELKPDAYLLMQQGCRAPDDCEDYLEAVVAGDISQADIDRYTKAGRIHPLYTRHTPDDMGGWISVEDRLPDVLGDYLMSYESPDGDTQIAWGFFTSDKKWANGNSFYVPTHWMPLPPGPVK